MMHRLLFSGEKTCSANCGYCFAKWANYVSPPKIEVCQKKGGGIVVYPCCDSDISQNIKVLENLWKIATESTKIYISIAVKRAINSRTLDSFGKLNQYLKENNKGFIKFSLSLTTKHRISELEPKTASYNERRKIFARFQSAGFYTAVILKPILPFISINEYKEIVDDFSECKYFVLGNLYVSEDTKFFKEYIEGRYLLEPHMIAWLEEHPLWQCVNQLERIKTIEMYIQSMNKQVFHCDVDLIEYISKYKAE